MRWWRSNVRHNAEQAGYSAKVLVEIVEGLRSFVSSLAHVAQAREGLLHFVRCTPLALAFVALSALGLWTAALPLRWAGLFEYDWRDAVKGSSFFALLWLRLLLPEVSSGVFFAVLRSRDEKLATSIKSTPSVYSKRARAKSFLVTVLVVGVVVALLATLGPLLLPLLAHAAAVALAAMGAFLAAWWLVLLIAVPIIVAATMMGFQAYCLLGPLVSLWRFDPVLMLLLCSCVALGSMKLAGPGTILRTAIVFYYSCSVLTHELLFHYTKRLDGTEQEDFKRRHRWRLLGFGLPIWVLVHYFPVVAVALLEVLHGAAASLLVDLLALESSRATKHN